MMISLALLAAFATGHLIFLIVLVNVSHGLGFTARWLDALVLAILALVGLVTIAGGIWLWGRPWNDWPMLVQSYAIVCYFTLFFVFPSTTLLRLRRTLPEGVTRQSEIAFDLCEEVDASDLRGHGPSSWPLRWPGNDSFRPHVFEWSVAMNPLPKKLDGLSLLHLTDFHFSGAFQRLYFEKMLAIAAEGPQPDFVFLTGDFLDDERAVEWIEPLFSSLRGRLGQFAILGNHDFRFPIETTCTALQDAGFEVLEGCWRTVDVDGARVAIGGTSFPWGRDLDSEPIPDADARIVLSHSPDQVYRASRWGVDLMLSGHNHGGQVRLPVIGPVLMPSRYSRRFDHGFFCVGTTWLYVSQGIWAKHPLRFRCPPEITRIVLRKADARPPHQLLFRSTDDVVASEARTRTTTPG